MILAALLVLSATVSIQIVEAEGLELTPRATLVDALEKEIRARTGWPVRSEEPAWAGACEGEGCPLRVPEGAEALTLSVFVASTRSRVLATRTDGTRAIATAKVDLSPDMAGWRTELRPMVDALYALVPRPAAELSLSVAPPPAGSRWPYLVLGAAALSAVVGGVFGAINADARGQLEAGPRLNPESQDARVKTFGLAANILFIAAGVGVAAGGAGLLLEL